MKLKHIFFGIVATMSLSVNATPIYSSSFADNGNKVTEVRTFGDGSSKTFEWLDLTVTNGISYNSLTADLADDGKLNNSSTLLGNAGALADVAALSSLDISDWETQSRQNIQDLFNNYFSLSVVVGTNYTFGNESGLVEEFIKWFGDTYHDGRVDNGFSIASSFNNQLSAYTYGLSNAPFSARTDINSAAYVYDGTFYNSALGRADEVVSDILDTTTNPSIYLGTWLAREVVPVSAPATTALFALAIVGLGLRRRLM